MDYSKIDLFTAKDVLSNIGKQLNERHLLIGGIAVNHYVKQRDSKDIDLICDYSTSQKIIQMFQSDIWEITDSNDDQERPDFTIKHRTDNTIIKFGPKIGERKAYDYLNWEHFLAENEYEKITHKNEEIKNIVIPNVSYLAYMKLISFYFRKNEIKRKQDLIDFINLSNDNKFSIALFNKIIKKNNAEEYLKNNIDIFLKEYSNCGLTSIIYNFMDYFKKSITQIKDENTVKRFSRGDSNFIAQMLDATLFFRDATVFATDEINQSITNNSVIPSRLLYKTESGCKKWLEICSDPVYSFYQKSYNNLLNKEATEIVDIIYRNTNRYDIDFISLGIGDGRKDILLLEKFITQIKDDSFLYYYPMDINLKMIEKVANNIHNSKLDCEKLKIKPFVGDFLGIDALDLIYNYRNNPNVFSILGNTIGNNEERQILNTLRNTIKSGDFLIIEFNTEKDIDSNFEKSKNNKEHDLSPITALGISIDKVKLTYQTIDSDLNNTYTSIPNTKTSIATCKIDKNEKKKYGLPKDDKEIKLSVVNYYTFDNFNDYVSLFLKMNIIYKSETNGIGIIVLMKQ